jgi:hypothetical protein
MNGAMIPEHQKRAVVPERGRREVLLVSTPGRLCAWLFRSARRDVGPNFVVSVNSTLLSEDRLSATPVMDSNREEAGFSAHRCQRVARIRRALRL